MGGAKRDGGNALLSSALHIWQLGVMPQALFHASTEMDVCKKKKKYKNSVFKNSRIQVLSPQSFLQDMLLSLLDDL